MSALSLIPSFSHRIDPQLSQTGNKIHMLNITRYKQYSDKFVLGTHESDLSLEDILWLLTGITSAH